MNLKGKKFGRLTVVGIGEGKRSRSWLCKCECGEFRTVVTDGLNNGHNKSCGCLRTDLLVARKTKHHMYRTKIYRIWHSMKQRCLNPNNKRYHDYGGRGITICDRWFEFKNFFDDMGFQPKNKTLDRINNDKGYNPENCKWSTGSEQQRNRRDNIIITYKGEAKPLIDWAEQLNITYSCLAARIKRGWTTERALTTP